MKKTLFGIAMGVALAAVACSCTSKKVEEQPTAVAAAPSKVEVIKVGRQQVIQSETYSSTILANVTNNIVPQSGSRIQKILVDVGSFVQAGQIVAEMDRVQLEQAELKLDKDKKELERVRDLYNLGGISQSDFESLELAYNVSKTTYENILENTILRSPVTGVITARNYDRGDMYTMTAPIFTVQEITPVKMLVGVSETDYTKIHKGDKVTVTTDAIPGRTFTGKINRLYPTIDAMSHTFNVEVTVSNADKVLRPGMFARVNIVFGVNNSIVVPDAAVVKMQGSGQKSVFVVKDDNTVESTLVTLGRHFDGQNEILSGLEEGQTVVVKGAASLRNGTEITIGE